ncbi:hypothetical protein A9Q99_11030 [Gammaproteobacteria bacterium 45_16_T64]|nr:hypothetical protein A9Q99_11030 [Gammaproteobacteria bacterium 45_16_T64]
MKRILLGSVALFAAGSALADGSPWLGSPGNATISTTQIFQTADKLYVGDDDMDLPDDLTQTTQWYSVSKVVSDNLSVDAKFGFAESDFVDSAGDTGTTDSTIGATWRVRDEFLSDSWLPSIAIRGAINVAGNYDEGEVTSIGDGASGAEASIIVGKVFNNVIALSTEIGYRYRDSGVDNDAFVNVNSYFQLTDGLSVSAGYHIVDAQGDLDLNDSEFTGDFTELAEDNTLADINVSYEFDNRLSITLTRASVLDGRNTAKSDISALSVGYTF